MNEHELFLSEMKKWHEMLTMTFKYYIPNGKSLPPSYEEAFFHLYKISADGVIEWLSKEPLTEDLPIQVDLFSSLIPAFLGHQILHYILKFLARLLSTLQQHKHIL